MKGHYLAWLADTSIKISQRYLSIYSIKFNIKYFSTAVSNTEIKLLSNILHTRVN